VWYTALPSDLVVDKSTWCSYSMSASKIREVSSATQWTISSPVVAAQGALALLLVRQGGSQVIGIAIAASGASSDDLAGRRIGARVTVTPV